MFFLNNNTKNVLSSCVHKPNLSRNYKVMLISKLRAAECMLPQLKSQVADVVYVREGDTWNLYTR